MYQYRYQYTFGILKAYYSLVMGGIENFLSRLLKDKIPVITVYCHTVIFTHLPIFFNEKFTKFVMSDEKYLLT